ncbi:MAG: hypothetical protein AAB706_03870 [Patescibacteria group bacterium]
MKERRRHFRPSIKRGDCIGHVRLALHEGEQPVDAFSRRAAEEIVAQAFSEAAISGPNFRRLINEVHETPYLKGCKALSYADILVDRSRPVPLLHSVKTMFAMEESMEPAMV